MTTTTPETIVQRQRFIGMSTGSFETTAERGRLRFFAEVIGDTDPVRTDLEAARDAGYDDLPVPPTFLMGLDAERPDGFEYLSTMGVDLRYVLHGSQAFTYHRVAVANEPLRYASRIEDVYEKSGGALQFIVRSVQISDGAGAPVADLRSTIIERRPGGAS
ncbi:MaoC family dehydratase N-terminal domain-containing protein [Patulibacter brassicae]|jgi:hypothetical protein|uniref:MaoC family dehydratase N-terminal domain-containing protein n=1 Tax=Patulibacter brassicae TaxID=1705717 RepID=A0ABU4VIG6_9ACTN|nr:MaoC family dehydratase N-terminal domain-containing protein [Patulibacter brassicae]MDX8150693.1 MaoC family dehydratase N-terminal domain-containing protein [Patulibacter brassicae]